ncbi:hypothetical protein [Paenibacillus sp. OK076]|uniref:hypothetical protein n=1 Tax=Paenibacillus sp. OK076 TaxID=1884379 RepID=UPI0008C68407|nr:hypothetical protein [Paenibacillus sp. OK076]SEP34489.1 hypothetical protein SAMN05518670_6652 [Paenibacillus sp. OK076]
MLLNDVVSRVRNLDWSSVGTVISKENERLGYEFFRRLASFFQVENITPISPKFTDISCLLGDTRELIDFKLFFNEEIIKYMNQFSGVELFLNFYLKLGKYVEDHPEHSKYIFVYEPLLKILERKGAFVFRVNELEIVGVSHLPLGGWYERFLNKPPCDIDNL